MRGSFKGSRRGGGDVSRGSFGTATNARAFTPDVDVRSDDESLRFVIDVPGVPLSGLSVEVENGTLTVSGERRYELADGREHVILGRAYGPFRLRFELPEWVDPQTIRARLTDGVLTLEVEKHATARRRKIRVLSGAPSIRALGPAPSDDDDDH